MPQQQRLVLYQQLNSFLPAITLLGGRESSLFFLPRFAECFSVVWLPLYGYNKFPASFVAK